MSDRALTTAVFAQREAELLREWLRSLKENGALTKGASGGAVFEAECASLLKQLKVALLTGQEDVEAAEFEPVRELLATIARNRASLGFTPKETALFVFSLKQPISDISGRVAEASSDDKLKFNWSAGLVLDRLGLFTIESYQKTREELIARQQQEISELSTPVIKLWDGILALPLIGTLDSQRTQVIMENLLEAIVHQNAGMAIIDITGVPTVDTLTAQHLLKTVAAARLMGAECIISGIRPQIAQTMVHLGVELNVISKSNLADAFAVALARQGRSVVKLHKAASADAAARD